MTHRTRRSFVTAASAAGTLGLAGCLSDVRRWRSGGDELPSESGSSGSESDVNDRDDLPGESFDSFEDLDGWVSLLDAGSLEADDEEPYVGTQSAHLTADEDTEYAGIYATMPDGMDLRESNLSLAVKFTGREQLQLTLELFAPGPSDAHTMRRTLTGPSDRWVRVDFETTSVDGQPDLANVREIRLTVRRRGDDTGSIDCWIDDLRTVDRPDRGEVLLLFDGTLESHHATAFEVVDKYDFTGVEAVIPEAVGETGRLTLDELDDLVDAGWDLAARPRTGSQFLHDYTPEEQEGLIRRTKAWLENRGFEDAADHFVTPRNVLGTTAAELVSEYHEQAFRYGGGPNAMPITDPHNLGFVSGAAGDETKAYVDYAAEYGQLAVLHFEHIGDDGLSEPAFEDLLDYIANHEVDVVTASDVLEDV
ncbi:polysaccharide deacetylase family protein [Natrialbaceae archaeon A-arb3/5]